MSSTELHTASSVSGVPVQRLRDRADDVSPSEPFPVFALKSLLYPVIPVLTLWLCLLLAEDQPRGPYLIVAVLAFLGVADLLDVVPTRMNASWVMALRSLLDIVLRWSLLMLFVFVLLDLADMHRQFSASVLSAWAVITPFALWVGELLAQGYLQGAGSKATTTRRALIVGATSVGLQLEHNLRARPATGVHVVGYFDDRTHERLPDACRSQVLGSMQGVVEYVLQHRVDIVYITLPMSPQPRIVELLGALRDSTASIYFVPDLRVFELVQPRFDQVDGIPVIAVCESPFYGIRGVAKRISDIVISSAAIVALAPVLLAVAAAVRISSPGPAIYRQRRYGLDGRQIVVYKFRSLRVVEDGASSYTQVTRDDARLTKVGAFIRRTSLDELPQLFNVLAGDMSIVGPRPHAIAVNEQYRRQIPGYMVRHKVKPGITGWAQVNGYRGGDDLDQMTKRISYDLEYLRHWSLGLDIIIMFKTAAMVWKDGHAY
jgi:putative colanic acid biosynthesis UDP-glucose lipid carrier transferase